MDAQGDGIRLDAIRGESGTLNFNTLQDSVNLTDIAVNQNMQKVKKETKMSSTIVIAEDEDFNFLLLKVMLSGQDLIILRASNGKEAFDLCKSNQQIELVLMDVRMPVMNGFEATKLIKAIRPTLPIIFQTAYTTDADKAEAYACGCTDFINKPINKEILIQKINNVLND